METQAFHDLMQESNAYNELCNSNTASPFPCPSPSTNNSDTELSSADVALLDEDGMYFNFDIVKLKIEIYSFFYCRPL